MASSISISRLPGEARPLGPEGGRAPSLPAYAAGIVNFDSYPELHTCLESLAAQTHLPRGIVVVDHDADPVRLRDALSVHPTASFLARPNRGFAAGANEILSWVERTCPEARFVLILNPDVALTPAYAATLVREAASRPRIALASGKLLRPDGRTIDSAGITMRRHRRPRDRGADQLDRRQFDRCETVFAVTGAAMLIRRSALPELSVDGEVFDEDFFAYHEDTDLAWRAGLLDWDTLYVPEARATHQRRWRADTRHRIEPAVRRHSFKNHYLEMIKNERPASFLRDLPVILAWEILRFGFSVLRDPQLLGGYIDALRLAPRAWSKRRTIQRRIREKRVATRRSEPGTTL